MNAWVWVEKGLENRRYLTVDQTELEASLPDFASLAEEAKA
jgi:hypothetical protein